MESEYRPRRAEIPQRWVHCYGACNQDRGQNKVFQVTQPAVQSFWNLNGEASLRFFSAPPVFLSTKTSRPTGEHILQGPQRAHPAAESTPSNQRNPQDSQHNGKI